MSELDSPLLSYLTVTTVAILGALMPLQFGSDAPNSAAPFIFVAAAMLWGLIIDQIYRYKSRSQGIALGVLMGFGFVLLVADSFLSLADKLGMMDYV